MSSTPRGLDFYVNWSQGAWAEERVKEAIDNTHAYEVFQYGPSRGDPHNTIEEFNAYLQQYQSAEEEHDYKRPDVLVIDTETASEFTEEELSRLESEDLTDTEDAHIIRQASAGIEVETSLWKIARRRESGESLSITVKKEDYEPLLKWQNEWDVPIHILQVFFDEAYIMPFDNIAEPVEKKEKSKYARVPGFSRRKDSSTGKVTYFINVDEFGGTRFFGTFEEEPDVEARFLENEDGKIAPYIAFKGGEIDVTESIEEIIRGDSDI